eukprot:TRINITY_DN8842_c0_g1_i1.p1 TRINITY_DN8842_c0_g1~~TRINITY_DN8842_c0_g1_i1.p1  ORF type:complete len:129 (+),score=8.24 TRINITY_DN8842_c0_g1_i1:24-410(+)
MSASAKSMAAPASANVGDYGSGPLPPRRLGEDSSSDSSWESEDEHTYNKPLPGVPEAGLPPRTQLQYNKPLPAMPSVGLPPPPPHAAQPVASATPPVPAAARHASKAKKSQVFAIPDKESCSTNAFKL